MEHAQKIELLKIAATLSEIDLKNPQPGPSKSVEERTERIYRYLLALVLESLPSR